MRDVRFQELDQQLGVLAERVLQNEARRDGRKYTPRYRPRFFTIDRTRHPLDRHFQCGFDPLNVSIKQYTAHIRTCHDTECMGRRRRWFDLGEYFKRRA